MARGNEKPPEEPNFGELDGEDIEMVLVEVKGTVHLDRLPQDGEVALIALQGNLVFDSVERVNSRLVKKFKLKADRGAEPADDLAEQVTEFLVLLEDEKTGRQQLPGLETRPDGTVVNTETGEIVEKPDDPKED